MSVNCDPSSLANAARCYAFCTPGTSLQSIKTYLLCNLDSLGGCVDDPARLIPVITGNYNFAGNLASLDITFPKVCCSSSGYGVYAAGGGLLQAGLIPPGHDGEINYQILGVDVSGIASASGLVVRQGCAGGFISDESNIVLESNLDPDVLDWAARVVINGGAAPSTNSRVAASTFATALKAANIWTKFRTLNMVAPDNLIAAETPLIVGTGLDPWPDVGSSNVVAADLTTYGIRFNGAKALNTGVAGTDLSLSSAGLTIIAGVINPNNGAIYDMGYLSAAAQEYMFIAAAQTGAGSTGHAAGSSFSTGLIGNTGTAYLYGGYLSYNRTTATRCDLYWANNDVAHSSIGNNTNNQTLGIDAGDIYFGGVRDSSGGATIYGKNTLSLGAVHDGLTAAESLAFFNAANALRTSFGGGYGDIGDSYVGGWVENILAAGGTTPGTTSKNAVHTLATSLWSSGIIQKFVAAAPLVSDSLIAAITPIFYQGVGNATWTNNNFIAGDLTANGLLGAATKYLDSGLIPGAGANNPLTVGSAGLIAYNHTNNATGVQHELAVYGAAFQSFFGLLCDYNAGTTDGGAWKYTGNDYVPGTTPASLTGFYSFQRTTTSRADIYFARSNVAHSSIANSAGLITGIIEPTQPVFAFGGNNNGGGVTGESLKRLSFLAITTGLSAAEDALAFTAIQAFRTALGGGFV